MIARLFTTLFVAVGLACANVCLAEQPASRLDRPLADIPTCTKPEWPKASLRRDEEGLTELGMLVRADGSLARAIVLQSSGYPALDQAALAGMSKCRFKPGTNNGKPVEMWTTLQYLWVLEDDKGHSQLLYKAAKAAANADPDALYLLSAILEIRGETDADQRRSLSLLRNAADLGQPMAQYSIGARYERGVDVERDIKEALRWYEKSAAQGNVLAIQRLRLGEMLR